MKVDFFFACAPTIENEIEQEIQDTKVASAKVAFDTVREIRTESPRTGPGTRFGLSTEKGLKASLNPAGRCS